jgi:hypothetical protein
MSANPGAYRYHAGLRGIVTPMDPLPIVEQAARRYGVRWLILERRHIVPSLISIYQGSERPTWLSPVAVVSVAGGDRAPDAVLVATCVDPGDTRCDE